MFLQGADRLANRRLADAVDLGGLGEALSLCQVAEHFQAFKLHNCIKQKNWFTVNQRFYAVPGPARPTPAALPLRAINGDGGSPACLIAL